MRRLALIVQLMFDFRYLHPACREAPTGQNFMRQAEYLL